MNPLRALAIALVLAMSAPGRAVAVPPPPDRQDKDPDVVGVLKGLVLTQPAQPDANLPSRLNDLPPIPIRIRVPVPGVFKVTEPGMEKAIRKGVDYLWSKQKPDGSWEPFGVFDANYPIGATALITYALLESGASLKDKRIVSALDWLGRHDSEMNYCIAFRAIAYGSAARKDKAYLKPMGRDIDRLLRNVMPDGGHTYYALNQPLSDKMRKDLLARLGGASDPSNTQYALLAAWAGVDLGAEIPRGYWEAELNYWIRMQRPDGGWGYIPNTRPGSYASMTVAALASLYVCVDNLYAARFADVGGNTEVQPVKRGLEWLEKDFPTTLEKNLPFYHYYLFGIERAAMASGYKHFGKIDWFQWGASQLLVMQEADGSWKSLQWPSGNDSTATAYALLFLIRGRQPVLLNKLQHSGDWNNRPRDLASLTRWLSYNLEYPVHWQIVSFNTPTSEWHDAPVLYIAGNKLVTFKDEEIDKLRQYVNEGGVIFSCVEGGGPGFSNGIRKVYQKMFPSYALTPLPPEHPFYSFHYNLQGRPKFHMITNGIRPLAFHVDEDLARVWQLYQHKTNRWAFEAGANLNLYVTDHTLLPARGTSIWVEPPEAAPTVTVKLARLKHEGNCDPEPLAYTRFARMMAREVGVQVEPTEPMDFSHLPDGGAKIAVMTGTAGFQLGDAQKKDLMKFLNSGGLLVMDAAGGSVAFSDSAGKLLEELFGKDAAVPLEKTSGILRIKGLEIPRLKTRPLTRKQLGDLSPMPLCAKIRDRPAVIFSPHDVTGGLLGVPSAMCDGYEPRSAFELMRNLVLFSAGLSVAEPPVNAN
jgi:hypothetical protein